MSDYLLALDVGGTKSDCVLFTADGTVVRRVVTPGANPLDLGLEEAARRDPGLANGINIYGHLCTNRNVAESLQLDYVPVAQVIG